MCIKIVGPPWIATTKGSSLKIFLRTNCPPSSWWRWSLLDASKAPCVLQPLGWKPSFRVWPRVSTTSNKWRTKARQFFVKPTKSNLKNSVASGNLAQSHLFKANLPNPRCTGMVLPVKKNVGAKNHGFFTQKCSGWNFSPFRNHISFRLWLLGKQGITHVTLYQLCRVLFFGVFSSFFP